MSEPRVGRLWMVGLLLVVLASPVAARDTELAHEDGQRESRQSSAGTGHVIAFDAPSRGEWWVSSVRLHGARYGGGYDPAQETFTVSVCDASLAPLFTFEAPYALFAAGSFSWVEVPLPRVVQVPASFKVVVAYDPTRTKGVFQGWAKTDTSHSGYGLAGGEERPAEADREWMIRAVLTDRPARKSVKQVDLALDDGAKTGHKSLGGGAHGVAFGKPSGTWWLESVRFFGQRYGGGYDPATQTFTLSLLTASGKVLHEEVIPYARVAGGPFHWVDVPLSEAVKVPRAFRVVLDFDPGRTRGVYVAYAAVGRKSHSSTGRADEKPRAFDEGEWMVRARLVSEKPQPLTAETPVAAAAHDARTYEKDLDFVAKTVERHFPALEKKGVDWAATVKAWRPRVRACEDDAAHVQNLRRLLALLGDMHTGVTRTTPDPHVPSFDGLYGAGAWIATEGEALVLRAWLPGHALEARVPRGSVLVEIDGQPAGDAHAAVRARLREWHGWSSTHFLDARLSFQFFDFQDKRTLPAAFITPDGERVEVELPRWGPGGRGLSRTAVTMPEGVAPTGKAVSTRLDDDIGYVRILGGMDAATQEAFFSALDALEGVEGILLDCRGMGGGGDGPAWAMAGRFFFTRTPLAHDPALVPTGSWTFAGPVVMLQDERMVSSAETFTWALVETGRAVSVGRPTGGATIIPRSFEVPSGMVAFRLGCRDRETSVRGVQPEGVGSPPDVRVPYTADLLGRFDDPVREVGLRALRRLLTGTTPEVVRALDAEALAEAP